jgi:hypothetical protein
MGRIFLGKPLHWALWIVLWAVFYLMDRDHLHVRAFATFILLVLALAAACVLIILRTSRAGERITREPFDTV